MGKRAFSHGPGHGIADGTVGGDQVGWDAEAFDLGRVGVGDEAAVDHIGGAGDLGEQGRDQATGTTLRGCEPQALLAEGVQQAGRLIPHSLGEHPLSSSRSKKETAHVGQTCAVEG